MGRCVEKLPHKCGSRDGLQVFTAEDGSYNAFCFSCGVFEADPYHDKPVGYKPPERPFRSPEDVAEELAEIAGYPTVDLPSRKLRKDVLERFGVKVALSQLDGVTPAARYFPLRKRGVVTGYLVKLVDTKKMWAVGETKGCDPFGWDIASLAGRKKLFITEGYEDAIALAQVFLDKGEGTKWAGEAPAVISINNGAKGAVASLQPIAEDVKRLFKEVVLVFDNDAPGREAANEVLLKVFPDALIATLPHGEKDANSCLINGFSKAMFSACNFQAAKEKNTRIVWGESLHNEARKAAEWGVSWPWDSLTQRTRGIRKGETIYLGAAPKMGKSELVDAIAAHLIKEHGWKILVAKPEQANVKTYKMMAGKMVGRVFHDPKVEFDAAAYDKAGGMLEGHIAMIDLYQHLGWDTLKQDIRAAAGMGVDAVFIDPITNLINGINSGDANTFLQGLAQELSVMALDLNITIFIMCHLRNPDSGVPHERGGSVLTSQFAGSRAMGRSCNYMFGLEGNKDPNLTKEERNVRYLVLLEDREFGESGRVRLYWDDKTTLFTEI